MRMIMKIVKSIYLKSLISHKLIEFDPNLFLVVDILSGHLAYLSIGFQNFLESMVEEVLAFDFFAVQDYLNVVAISELYLFI